MAKVSKSVKAASVNPLKMSSPLGACQAFLGIDRCMPMMHGSQGCASLGLVLLGRHYRETIPIQTSAMNEVTSILGGHENLEQAILNIRQRAKPELIGICSTGLTETRGDDVSGHLTLIRQLHPELADTAIVHVSTPDYIGAFQDGWANAVLATIRTLVQPAASTDSRQVNILAGCHLTVADIEEIREIVESFGLRPIILPDISGSLDGHIPDDFSPTTIGGTSMADIKTMGGSVVTLAIGEQMRASATELERITGIPFVLFDCLTGLEANDRFLAYLSWLSDLPIPARYRRQRSQLQDAMLDAHFSFGGKKVAIGAEPDLLWSLANLVTAMGCVLKSAVTTTESPLLENIPVDEVLIGDLEDLEAGASGCDLLITHSHGRQAAARLDIPFYRAGLPIFDRLGAAHQLSVGYRGTRGQLFTIGNIFLSNLTPKHPGQWQLPESSLRAIANAEIEQSELKKES
ncbi:MAG: nitrogenase molybdenum-cofactor synthesis protein NifN protein [Burkholderiaceae bacterium]|nr:nitrogenase molybdenum-cofactor synthesis protein NifN protein [Burkholderiaceae bacterium]